MDLWGHQESGQVAGGCGDQVGSGEDGPDYDGTSEPADALGRDGVGRAASGGF